MAAQNDNLDADLDDLEREDMDVTAEQLAQLRALGVAEADLEGLDYAEAEEWIDELRARQRDAGKFGR
jgi:hypothetical protein